MKPIKYILLLVLSLVFTANSIAQKQKSKPINSGFVFIDGVYIKPPYRVKQKDYAISINNIPVYIDTNTVNPNKIEVLPNFYDYFNDSSTLNDLFKKRINGTQETFFSMIRLYYLGHYHEDDGLDSLANYMRKLPMIKEVTINKDWGTAFTIISIHSEIKNNVLVSSMYRKDKIYKKYHLSNEQYQNSRKTKNIRVFNKYINELTENNIIYIKGIDHNYRNYKRITNFDIAKTREILQSNINNQNKIDSIIKITNQNDTNFIKDYIKEFKNNSSFKKRINNIGSTPHSSSFER